MEPIGATAAELTRQNEQIKTSSQNQPISTTSIPRDIHASLFTIINKARLLNGWTMKTAKELDPTIKVWFAAFEPYKIPTDCYDELYRRCIDLQQTRLRDNNEKLEINAPLMISQWTGPHGLERELRQREIDAGRSLPSNAQSRCDRCFATGWEHKFDGDGNNLGMLFPRIPCDHRPAAEGEKLFPEPRLKAVG